MPRPGWYPDPERSAPARWWDGHRWTAWLADSRRAPYPPPGPVESVPAKDPVLARRLLIAGGAVAVAATGLTGLGMSIDADNRRRSLAEARPSALGTPAPSVQPELELVVDDASRVVRWSRLFSAVLPGKPFEILKGQPSPTFESYIAANNVTDTGWTSKDPWWPASCLAGVPKKELVDPSDISGTAGNLAAVLRDRVYPLTGAQGDVTAEPVTSFGSRQAFRATAPVTFTDKGSAQRLRLRVTIVQAHPLAHLAWVDMLQERSSPESAAALDAAYQSIWVA